MDGDGVRLVTITHLVANDGEQRALFEPDGGCRHGCADGGYGAVRYGGVWLLTAVRPGVAGSG